MPGQDKDPKRAALPLHTFFFCWLFSSEAEGLRSAPLCSPSQSGGGCCGLGRMRGGVIQRARSRPGQEGARDISAGWVKQLQGWRSDRTGSRRSRPKHWAKLTGTLSFLELYLLPFFFFRLFFNALVLRVLSLHCAAVSIHRLLNKNKKNAFVEVSSLWSFLHTRKHIQL